MENARYYDFEEVRTVRVAAENLSDASAIAAAALAGTLGGDLNGHACFSEAGKPWGYVQTPVSSVISAHEVY